MIAQAHDTGRVLFMIAPILGETEELVQERKRRRAALAGAANQATPGVFWQVDQRRFFRFRPRQALSRKRDHTATS
jgi:hypothetical protein